MRLAAKKESALQAQVRERDSIIKILNERIAELERVSSKQKSESSQPSSSAVEITGVSDETPLSAEESVDYAAILKKISEESRILVVGGNQNLVKRLRVMYPKIVFIGDERIGNCDSAISHADFVFFKVDSISHSLYGKAKDIAQSFGVNIGYIPVTTSTAVIEKCIAENILSKRGGN